MVLGNKPTFDPYSIGEFSLRDAFRAGIKSWRNRRWAFLAFALLACLPAVFAFHMEYFWLNLVGASVAVIVLLAVVSPIVARTSRGLSAELRGTLSQFKRRALSLALTGSFVGFLVGAPGLLLLQVGLLWGYLGLLVGVALGAPFVLSIPVVMVESMSMKPALKRSLFLVRGRKLKTYPILSLLVLSAVAPAAVMFIHPGVGMVAILLQPFLICFSAVGVGALYVNLYEH